MTGKLVYTAAFLSFGWREFMECFYDPHCSDDCCFRLFRICLVVVVSLLLLFLRRAFCFLVFVVWVCCCVFAVNYVLC